MVVLGLRGHGLLTGLISGGLGRLLNCGFLWWSVVADVHNVIYVVAWLLRFFVVRNWNDACRAINLVAIHVIPRRFINANDILTLIKLIVDNILEPRCELFVIQKVSNFWQYSLIFHILSILQYYFCSILKLFSFVDSYCVECMKAVVHRSEDITWWHDGE